jgi:Flp pilus assembly protein TadG
MSRLHSSYGKERTHRDGSVSIYFLLILPILLLIVAIAIVFGQLVETKTESYAGADAAALAAAQTLVDDAFLTDEPSVIRPLLMRATEEAQKYAADNLLKGQKVVLQANATNDDSGDVVFGTLNRPRDRVFISAKTQSDDEKDLLYINTVQITVRRTADRGNAVRTNGGKFLSPKGQDMIVRAMATLDRDVIGFRPIFDKPLPIVPIALRSDPSGNDPNSWEFQVRNRGGADEWRFNAENKVFVNDEKGDAIHEMLVTFGNLVDGDIDAEAVNACLLQIGSKDFDELAEQVRYGLAKLHLESLGGQLLLGPDNRLAIPGSPRAPQAGSREFSLMFRSLEQIQLLAEPRIWPLVSGANDDGAPIISGFVAARIVRIPMPEPGKPLRMVVQACSVSQPAAVTDSERRGAGGIDIHNPYISRVRLVK